MLNYGAKQLVLKLELLFQGKEKIIADGKLLVCLTIPIINFLNDCFEDTQQYTSSENRSLEYLKHCVQLVHSLKIVRGPTLKSNYVFDVSQFKALRVLEIENIAVGMISGLQSLRPRLKVIKCSRSLNEFRDVITLCGYDLSSAFSWPLLEKADFSFNSIRSLDSSLHLLTSIQCLDLSHNSLTNSDDTDEEWMYLPEVRNLRLDYNFLIEIPVFPESCRSSITSLSVCYNGLTNIKGLEFLKNLKYLDVSANCISSFQSFYLLTNLDRLTSIYFYGNPISHHESYRLNVVSCLSRSLRRSVIALDDKTISVKEMCYLGKFLEMPFNSHNPSPTHGPTFDTIQSGLEATVSSGEERTCRTHDKKRKNRHNFVRQVSIRNIDDEEESSTGSSQPKVNVKINSEVEKLEKFKKDAGEGYLVVRNQQQLRINDPEHSSSLSTEIPSSQFPIPEATEAADVIIESPEFDRKELLEEVDSHEVFMISVNMSEQSESYEDMFVSVKNHELVERNIQLKIVHRLDLNGLLDIMMTSLNEEKAVVILKFDYVNKNRKYREYQFDDISRCEEFISLLKAFGPKRCSENLENEPEKYFKCIKCLTEYVATNEEISTCSNCDSLFVIEIVKNQDKSTLQSSFKDTLRSGQTIQHPDVVPCVMRESTAPPDVCKDTSCPATDGETFVDTEKALDGEYNCSIDGQNLSSDNNEQLYTSDKEPLFPKERGMSAKINISQDSYSDTLSRCSYSYKSSDSYLASSYSSQSGSETVYSSSVGGTSSTIDFDRDSSTHCDHRLKLFLEMKFFRGEEPEEFRCMIKCAVTSYGHRKGRRGILIVSNKNVYICRINGVESVRPKEWLSLKTHYLITELRYIECGFNYQSFRLEFAKALGCYVFLVGDRKRTEDFLKTFRRVCKKARDGKRLAIGRKNPQTLANIRIQVLGLKDEDLMLKGRRFYDQAVNFTVPPLIKDHKSWFRTYPQSMLGADFIDWLTRCKEASNFHDAVHIGQMLLNAGIIRCFNKDCGFLDKDQYYSFNFSHEFSEEENSEISEESKSETADDKSSTMLYIIAQWKDEERWRPISIVMSDDQIILADENHQWPLPRLHEPPKGLEGPQFTLKKKQKIINITEVTLFSGSPRKIEIEFLDEETVHVIEDDRWTISMHSENSLANFLDGIKEIWKTRFCIDLPVNTLD